MELMVYIAIASLIVLVAGQAYSNSTRMRVRTQSMLKANDLAEKIGTIIKDDIAQMGAKSTIQAATTINSNDDFSINEKVYNSTNDRSSYVLIPGDKFDRLTFKRAKYSESGVYQSVEQIAWYVQEGVLMRSCTTIDGTEANDCPANGQTYSVEIAQGIDTFKVYQALPENDSGLVRLFPSYVGEPERQGFRLISYYGEDNYVRVITSPNSGDKTVSLYGFSTNFNENGIPQDDPIAHMVLAGDSGSTDDNWKLCKPIEFNLDSSLYEIQFSILDKSKQMRMFIPNKDHFSVGLRIPGSYPQKITTLSDFMIFPPEETLGASTRRFRFNIPRPAYIKTPTLSACVAFSFSFFSPSVNAGVIDINSLQVNKITETSYTIPENEAASSSSVGEAAKKMVKAFKLKLVIKKNGEAGKFNQTIPVPSNGIKG